MGPGLFLKSHTFYLLTRNCRRQTTKVAGDICRHRYILPTLLNSNDNFSFPVNLIIAIQIGCREKPAPPTT